MARKDDIESKFWEELAELQQGGIDMIHEKSKQYVANGRIIDFWINGPSDLVYEINKKCLRLKRQMKQDQKDSKADAIEDTLVDLSNYALFLAAYLRARKGFEDGK
jgi:hypothetical protein